MRYTLILLLSFCSLVANAKRSAFANAVPVKVQWLNKLPGDYSFKNKWDYPEGVYKNEYGQLVCDGLCPEGIEGMLDSNGRIYKDSIAVYYKLLDTSHQYHAIVSESTAPEWGSTDYITVTSLSKGKSTKRGRFYCSTFCNAATHSSLTLSIVNGICYAQINFNSIKSAPNDDMRRLIPATGGYIKIDQTYLTKGIMKAEFSFDFADELHKTSKIFWKGKIYQRISHT